MLSSVLFATKVLQIKGYIMVSNKKNYDANFKAKVALESIRNEKVSAEICSEYKIPSTNLYEWRDKALNNLYKVFVPENEYMKREKALEEKIECLHKIIGEITIENNFLKKKLQI